MDAITCLLKNWTFITFVQKLTKSLTLKGKKKVIDDPSNHVKMERNSELILFPKDTWDETFPISASLHPNPAYTYPLLLTKRQKGTKLTTWAFISFTCQPSEISF